MSVVRPGTIIWFCIVVAVGYAMFQVKYEVMQQEQTLAGINKQIAGDREQIRVLDAEWSYLTRPTRIEQLAGRFLHLSTLSSAQIVDLAAVPERSDAAAQPGASDPPPPRKSPRTAAVVGKPAP
jgi:cell division protein FtsL